MQSLIHRKFLIVNENACHVIIKMNFLKNDECDWFSILFSNSSKKSFDTVCFFCRIRICNAIDDVVSSTNHRSKRCSSAICVLVDEKIENHYSKNTFYYLKNRIRIANFLLNVFILIFRHFTEKNHYEKDDFRKTEWANFNAAKMKEIDSKRIE